MPSKHSFPWVSHFLRRWKESFEHPDFDGEQVFTLKVAEGEQSLSQQLSKDTLDVQLHASAADSILSQVDQQFEAVLKSHRVALFKPKAKSDVERLHYILRELLRAFHDALWRSRELAGKAQALASDFSEICSPLLRDPAVPARMKISELGDYEKLSPRHTEEARDFDKMLSRLSAEVKNLHTRWSDMASQSKTLKRKGNQISELLAKLSEILGVLSTEPLKSDTMSFLLLILSPSFANELDSQAHFPASNEVRSSRQEAQIRWASESRGLVLSLSALSHLVLAIHLDIQRLKQQFERSPPNNPLPNDVNLMLDHIDNVYEPLISSLQQYQSVVALA